MIFFLLCASAVYAVITGIALVTGADDLNREPRLMLSVLLSGWLVPTMTTWIVAEITHALTPRRVFDRRLFMPVRRVVLGLLSGVIGSVLGVIVMALLDNSAIPDAALTAAAAAVATVLVILPIDRVRKGVCVYCGYSLAGATPAAGGVCSECGQSTMAPARA